MFSDAVKGSLSSLVIVLYMCKRTFFGGGGQHNLFQLVFLLFTIHLFLLKIPNWISHFIKGSNFRFFVPLSCGFPQSYCFHTFMI